MVVSADDGNPLTQLTLDQLRRRTSVKWRLYPPDVLPLWVAEQDVPLAPPVAEALRRAVELGDTGYAYGTAYAEAVGGFAAQRWGWADFPVGRTTLVPDVMMGTVEVLRLVTGPGDAVVVTPPVYPPFYAFVTHADRQVIEAPLGADLRLDPAALEEAFRRARAIGDRPAFLLCNPHNPTGVVHRPDELATVAELAARHGVRVVSDEIHSPLALPGARFTPYLTVPGRGERVRAAVGVQGVEPRRAQGGAGGRRAGRRRRPGPDAGGGEPRPQPLRGARAHRRVPGRRAVAGPAARRPGREPGAARVAAGRAPAHGVVAAARGHVPGLAGLPRPRRAHGGAATDRAVASDLAGPARMFLDRARVALSSGHVFGAGGAGFVRLNFATSPAVLTEAVTRMGRAVLA